MESVLVFEGGNGLLTKALVWQGFSGRKSIVLAAGFPRDRETSVTTKL